MALPQINGFAVITGAAGGIGKETGFTFAEAGAKGVLFGDVDGDAAARAAEESRRLATNQSYKAVGIRVDVTDARSVQDMVDRAVGEFGRVDHCVNAAGVDVERYVPAIDTAEADYDRVMDVNAKGAFLVGRAVAKIMQAQDPATVTTPRHGPRSLGRGSIVNIASAMSHAVVPAKLPYAASKHAMLGITRSLAMDLKSSLVRVNQVSPIWVETPMFSEECRRTPQIPDIIQKIVPLQRAIGADEVAAAVMYLCGPAAGFVNGWSLLMDGGMLVGPSFA